MGVKRVLALVVVAFVVGVAAILELERRIAGAFADAINGRPQ